MKLDFNRLVQRDLRSALSYLDREGGSKLGDRFFAEVEATLAQIAAHPQRFGFLLGDIRRARLHVFAYHFLYRIKSSGVRILALRHNRQHPRFGLLRT